MNHLNKLRERVRYAKDTHSLLEAKKHYVKALRQQPGDSALLADLEVLNAIIKMESK